MKMEVIMPRIIKMILKQKRLNMKNVVVMLFVLLPFVMMGQEPAKQASDLFGNAKEKEVDKNAISEAKNSETGKVLNFNGVSDGTTMEEFLYCTKGYATQISQGLDAQKKGYEIKSIDANTHQNTKKEFWIFETLGMYKDGKIRALIVHRKSTKYDYDNKYYCVVKFPVTIDVMKKYKSQFQSLGSSSSYGLILAINKMAMLMVESRK